MARTMTVGGDVTLPDLRAMRTWRSTLLVAAAVLVGLQDILAPVRPHAYPGYHVLAPIGVVGWRVIGGALLLHGALLTLGMVTDRVILTRVGFLFGAVVWLALTVALVLAGYSPGLLVLATGLCIGEVIVQAVLDGRTRAEQ